MIRLFCSFVIYSLLHWETTLNFGFIVLHYCLIFSFDSAFSSNKQFQSIHFCYVITFAYCLASSSLVLGLISTNLLIFVKENGEGKVGEAEAKGRERKGGESKREWGQGMDP